MAGRRAISPAFRPAVEAALRERERSRQVCIDPGDDQPGGNDGGAAAGGNTQPPQPAPAAPQPATQVPQMAPGQLVIDPFATPVAVPQAPQAVPPADAGGLTLPPSMSDR